LRRILQQFFSLSMIFGSVASVKVGYGFEENSLSADTLRHKTCKIVERSVASFLPDNLSFLNHADIFNARNSLFG
jgi:hypothetical protein